MASLGIAVSSKNLGVFDKNLSMVEDALALPTTAWSAVAALYCDFDGDGRSEIPVTSPWGIGILGFDEGTLRSEAMAENGTRLGEWLLATSDNRFDAVGDFDGDGRSEMVVASPWGIGMLKQSGGSFDDVMLAPNGTRFGEWLLNTADNRFGPVGDFDGDGKDEILVTSPWGIGVLKLSGNTFTMSMMAPNGTRFGEWLLNTGDNRFGPVGDLDGDGKDEILVTSPWGIGVLKLSGGTVSVPMMAPNGTRFGEWLLNTADNHFCVIADFDGDRTDEILVTSPWGMGILELTGNTLSSPIMVANGTRIGEWLLNTLDNRLGPVGDFDGDGKKEILISSPWGMGVLRAAGAGMETVTMAPNGTRFGEWLLNTGDNCLDMVGDFDGDGRDEILIESPWGVGVLELTASGLNAAMLAPNGTRFGEWLLSTVDNQFGIGMETVRLHVKILTEPTVPIEQMLVNMQWVYEAVGVRVQRVSSETLNLPLLNDLDVGTCGGAASVTTEQTELFGNRNGGPTTDVVVYFVRSTEPPLNGCAAHPDGEPSVVVTQGASSWTLAHEVGHVLGLPHCDSPGSRLFDRLMTGGGTASITNPPPDLTVGEINQMKRDKLTHPV